MKEYRIGKNDAGMRLDKFCARILQQAPVSFIYKMLRKKNITLNAKKAKGNELLKADDVVRFYLSDQVIASFASKNGTATLFHTDDSYTPDIVYEDSNILIVNKSAGILSQKSKSSDMSMNEYCILHCIRNGSYDPNDPVAFKPAVCNRLDRNTSGLLLVAKTHAAASILAQALKDRSMDKYYSCIACGMIRQPFQLKGYLKKDEKTNKVRIMDHAFEGADAIETEFEPIVAMNDLTLLHVKLITGKSHQIRAHLQSIAHPILGDPKYGDPALNRKYGCKNQLLHAFMLKMPPLPEPMQELSGMTFQVAYPDTFKKYMRI